MIVGSLPRLDRDLVHVWIASTDVEEPTAREFIRCLSDDERARAWRFWLERDRRRFGVARAMLRHVLSAYLPSTEPGDLRFACGDCGKPHLVGAGGAAGLRFNASRSIGLAAVAVTRGGAVGVDLEVIRPELVDDRLAAAVLSAAELDDFRRPDRPRGLDREHVFFAGWTRKEALLKAVGTGLSCGLEAAEAASDSGRWRLWALRPAATVVGAVAASAEKTKLMCLEARIGASFLRVSEDAGPFGADGPPQGGSAWEFV